jgi:hypothetical protein
MTMLMNQRYRIYRRKVGVYYLFDGATGKRESLGTQDPVEAKRLLHTKNEALANPQINLQIARAYMANFLKALSRSCGGTCIHRMIGKIALKRHHNHSVW